MFKNKMKPNKNLGAETKRNQHNRGQEGGRAGGKPPPGLGGLGGSEDQRFRKKGGSEDQKKRIGEKKNSEEWKNGGRSTRRHDGSADSG